MVCRQNRAGFFLYNKKNYSKLYYCPKYFGIYILNNPILKSSILTVLNIFKIVFSHKLYIE